MSVIAELALPADEFELGRILSVEGDTTVVLETMVPLGDRSVPFFRVRSNIGESFERTVRDHDVVTDVTEVSSHDGEILYALDWDVSDDAFFECIMQCDADVLEAMGTARNWRFELRLPDHDSLSTFQADCHDADVPIEVRRIYNPTEPSAGPWYGLTPRQRETLCRAVEAGYYSIPRRISTQDLAAEFDVSDQAVTERLRRSIVTLTRNSLLVSDEED